MITPNAKNLAGAQWYTHVRLSPRSSITPALPFLLFPFLPRTPSARTRTPTSKWTPTSSASSASARSARARTPISPFPSTHLPSLLTTHLRRLQREHEWVQLCCAARAQGDGVHDGKAYRTRALSGTGKLPRAQQRARVHAEHGPRASNQCPPARCGRCSSDTLPPEDCTPTTASSAREMSLSPPAPTSVDASFLLPRRQNCAAHQPAPRGFPHRDYYYKR
ncbi:hypothetical protein K438DRAFT_2028674 [Mycena galopus ATCC 62051]|nr:hypothetical protein K438DRAFT_2028674 [Mycena galopus ATCC 62051]